MINISIKSLKFEKHELGSYYEHFLIDNLQPGQGLTIANQLRRVLLGDLESNCISAVRIIGINHEFATIPGVREDILEIMLNLKGVIIKGNCNTPTFGRLKVQGPLVITADQIELSSGFEIINPNHYIATISKTVVLEMEFKIESGTSYKLASHVPTQDNKNFLQMDTVFMPVQKVNFKITNFYDNENYIIEQVFLEVWTDGSILPFEAVKKASQITVNLFTSLTEIKDSEKIVKKDLEPEIKSLEPYTDIAIEELQLSVRSYNCLKKAKINTVSDLLEYTPEQLQELKNFGKKSADEVFSTLKNKLGIILNQNKEL